LNFGELLLDIKLSRLKRQKMMKDFNEKMCPQCHHARLKAWSELTPDEKILAERLPMSATFTRRERETHRFCPRCWFEQTDKTAENC
jgi:hypothetical protein